MNNMIDLSDIIQICILVVILLQLHLTRKTVKADHERRRKQATFEYVNAVSERFRKALYDFDKEHGIGKVVDVSNYSETDIFTVRSYLSEIERICAGVNSEVFDYDILKKMMAGSLIENNNRFRQYIDGRRVQKHRPSLYMEFDEVTKRLKKDRNQKYENVGKINSI